MKKFAISLISLFLCISLAIPYAFAATDISDHENNPSVATIEKMERLLTSIQEESSEYCLENINFNSVSVGYGIPTYEYISGSLQETSIIIYPIFDDKTVVANFTSCLYEGEEYVQISTDYVDLLTNSVAYGDSIAIVYDAEKTSIICDSEIKDSFSSSEEANSERDILDETSSVETFSMSPLSKACEIQAASIIVPYSLTTTSSYLLVDKIAQPSGTSYCWACAMASILNYVYDEDYTALNITNKVGSTTGKTTRQVVMYMGNYYDLYYSWSTYGSLSLRLCLANLSCGYPLYGSFTYGTSGRHAAVIRGCNTSTSTFSVMNPYTNVSSYTSGTVSAGNAWVFTSKSGNVMTLSDYACYITE